VPTSWVAMVQNTTMGDVAVTAFAVCARGA